MCVCVCVCVTEIILFMVGHIEKVGKQHILFLPLNPIALLLFTAHGEIPGNSLPTGCSFTR